MIRAGDGRGTASNAIAEVSVDVLAGANDGARTTDRGPSSTFRPSAAHQPGARSSLVRKLSNEALCSVGLNSWSVRRLLAYQAFALPARHLPAEPAPRRKIHPWNLRVRTVARSPNASKGCWTMSLAAAQVSTAVIPSPHLSAGSVGRLD